MRLTIAGLRRWIAAAAALLALAVAAFLGYARYQARRVVGDLPGKLGIQIARSSNGFTYSQSVKGQTAFTIHASNAVQYKGGASATLRDVVITLYGSQGDRNDRISGSEFDYDKKTGIVTAKGEVQIDLQGAGLGSSASSGGQDAAAARGAAKSPGSGVIHVKTSGLVFDQNAQIATTAQHVEFSAPNGSGQATGAAYDVRKGLLVLQSAVELTSERDGEPITVRAAHAEFFRSSLQASLLRPAASYRAQEAAAGQATVHFRKDGSAEQLDAEGNVDLKTEDGQEMTCRTARILLDSKSRPQRADASGGVSFVDASAANNTSADSRKNNSRHLQGNAAEATLTFSPGGILSHAQARNAVSFVDREESLGGDRGGAATRELRAARVDADFAPDAAGRAQVVEVRATGEAVAVLRAMRTNGASQNTTVKGDRLVAVLSDGRAIANLHGSGHTSVLDTSPSGAANLSTGDTLLVNFFPPNGRVPSAKSNAVPGGAGVDSAQIQSVEQQGNVVIVQTPSPTLAKETGGSSLAARNAPQLPTKAFAGRADYDAGSQVLKLTGSPRIDNGATEIAADAIEYRRDSQVANATGNVKTTYRQAAASTGPEQAGAPPVPGFGGEGPVHVVSASASLDQPRGVAVFRGQARLWQGANSVGAPVIEVTRNPETLKAYAEPAVANAVVTVIATVAGPQRRSGVFRVSSRQLLYVDASRKATFSGAVAAEDANGIVHTDQVEAFLRAAAPPAKPGGAAADASGVQPAGIDRIVATGRVVLQQPGRRGAGDKLLYTAEDGKFRLTGTSAVPPRLYDSVHGNVTGDALIFNSRDDSVSVTGGRSKAVTDTRAAR